MVHKITRKMGIGKEILQCFGTESNEHETEYSQFQLIYIRTYFTFTFNEFYMTITFQHFNISSTFNHMLFWLKWNACDAKICGVVSCLYARCTQHFQQIVTFAILIFCCEWYVQYYFIRSTSIHSNLFRFFVFWFDWIEHSVWWLTIFFSVKWNEIR